MGISEIMVVLGGHLVFFHLLETAIDSTHTLCLSRKGRGIAEALNPTKEFVADRNQAVILGDNVFEESMKEHLEEFEMMKISNVIFS